MTNPNENKKNTFSFRAFVSVLATLSFIGAAVSGSILFITPPGRIANWTNWKFWSLTKHQWGDLHIWFCLTFLITALLHIYLNIKPLLNYFKSRVTRKFSFRAEWLAALIICGVILTGTLAYVPPFSTLIDWDSAFKESWGDNASKAPIPHAELMTLPQIAKKTGGDLDQMLTNLKEKNITPESLDITLEELGNKLNMQPSELYNIAIGNTAKPGSGACGSGANQGGGMGRGGGMGSGNGMGRGGGIDSGNGMGHGSGMGNGKKTLKKFCQDYNLEVQSALKKLKDADIEATADQVIRDIAVKNDMTPPEVVDILRK